MTTTQGAEQIFTDVAAGKTVFTKAADGTWMLIGPAASIKDGKSVIVTKRDGSTTTATVGRVTQDKTARGVAYRVATVTKGAALRPTQTVPARDTRYVTTRSNAYTTVQDASFGEGRVYADQPGATQYRDSRGGFGTQIWDNE